MSASNWFYYYDNAERKGPFSIRQIKDLAVKGKIKPDTIIASEDGRQVKAERVPGISFPAQTALPSGFSSSTLSPDNPYISKTSTGSGLHFDPERPAAAAVSPKIAVRKTTVANEDSSFSFFGWLFDIGFKQSYVMKFIRLMASIFYVISLVLILLGGLVWIGITALSVFSAFRYSVQAGGTAAFLVRNS